MKRALSLFLTVAIPAGLPALFSPRRVRHGDTASYEQSEVKE